MSTLPPVASSAEIVSLPRADYIEKRLVGVLLWQKSTRKPSISISEMEKRFVDIIGDRGYDLLEQPPSEKEILIFEAESHYSDRPDISIEMEELLISLEEEHLKKKFSEAMENLQKSERDRDSAAVLKYLEECQNISQQINNLKKYEKK
jgi:hypothetical protein